MNGNPDELALIALGAAISDGAAVNWDELERQAENPERQRLFQDLRQLARLASVHRSAQSPSFNSELHEASTARVWRHLVLFESIGLGAFGTVYRGWDSQVDREVAVKLLPKTNPTSASPLAEARNLARVRHHNVVIVHGADQDDHGVGIWMEYIDGQTLAAMVRSGGPMSAREVAGIGIDLCHALSALHAAGLLHLDIKAHNVMREVGGRIVLMDFSGAQRIASDNGSNVFSGTPLFMAPELFAGRAATVASDVYSLGVLLFFLLTGGVPVDGATVADLKSAHARQVRRRLRDLRPDLPDGVVHVIERSTEHEPGARYQTAGELERALAAISGSQAVAVPANETAEPLMLVSTAAARWQPSRVWLWGALLLMALVVTAVIAWGRPEAAPVLSVRFTVGPPYTTGSWPRVSPDGRLLVFGTIVEGRNRFWIRALDALEGRPLMNTSANETPFWSPDGRTLVFFADEKMKKIPVDGGEPEVVADAPRPHGGDWSGNWIVFASERGIRKVAPDGSGLSVLTTVDESLGDYQHAWPEFLPDGRRYLYLIRSSRPERTGVYVGSTDGAAPWRLMPAYSRVAYSQEHLLFVRQGTLLAQPFDADTVTLSGQPIALSGRVKYHAEADGAFDVSSSGVLIYCLDSGQPSTRLVLVDRRGRELQALTGAGGYRQPRFSPDGQRVVAERVNPARNNADLWLYGVARQSAVRLTSSDAPDVKPVWSPDGKRIVFSSKRDALFHIFSKTVDDTRTEQAVITLEGDKFVEDWSRDGRYLTAAIFRSGLWIIPLDSGHKPWLARADTRADTWQSEFSPDGRWLAYMSEESGAPEVYVEPFPATGSRWQVSTRGGAEPHWRGDAKELFYLSEEGTLMSTDVLAPNWQTASPTPLFRMPVPDLTGHSDYAVAPDGELFVVNVFLSDPVVPPIEVVVNWTSLFGR
jgi:Tol biopolymer transport system component